MSADAKERIRELLDIADVIGETVVLKPAGRGQLKGLCPFHNEKTPSFHVHRERGFYYCFGCQAKGDLFDFVMQTRGIGFFDALQELGRRAGVEVAPQSPQERGRQDLYRVNEMALDFYRGQLAGDALGYLEGRGLTRETIATWGLGFAPNSWDALLRHAAQLGWSGDALLAAGLVSEAENGRRYDRFRGRIIFPIRDHLGRVVGFAGRVLAGGEPKYLNTPETGLFRKGELLYGLDRAKGAIRESGECIVVEGYMDVLALHQAGFENAVASLGAALTAEQAAQLGRQGVQRLLLAFDTDAAGQRAVLAGLDHSVGRDFLVSAVAVPAGKDPADAVLGGHVDEFRRALGQGLSEVAFRFEAALAKHDHRTLAGQQAILTELLPTLRPRGVFDPVAAEMRRLVIDHLDLDGARLDEWLAARRQRPLERTQVRGLQRAPDRGSRLVQLEFEIIALLLQDGPRLEERVAELEGALPPDAEGSLLAEFSSLCRACGFDADRVLLEYREREEARTLFERLISDESEEEARSDLGGHIEKALARLRELYLEEEKERQRQLILERMEQVGARLEDPTLPPDQLEGYYAELRELGSVLAARDAERRLRLAAGSHRRGKQD